MRYLSLALAVTILVFIIGCGGGGERVTTSEEITPATVDTLGAPLIKSTKMLETVDSLIRAKKTDEGLDALKEAYEYIHHINNCYLQLINARAYIFHAMLYVEVKRYSDARDFLGKAVKNLQAGVSSKNTPEDEKAMIDDIVKKVVAIADEIEIAKGKKLPELAEVYKDLNTAIEFFTKGAEVTPEEPAEEEGK